MTIKVTPDLNTPIAIGRASGISTFSVNHLFDANGDSVAMVYGIGSNSRLEDLDPKYDQPGLNKAAYIVLAVNNFAPLFHALSRLVESVENNDKDPNALAAARLAISKAQEDVL
jgi:hypothetical protein